MMRGRVLYVDSASAWLARGRSLFKSRDGGLTWVHKATLPCTSLREKLAYLRIGARLGRVGFHHFIPMGSDHGLAFAHNGIYRLDPGIQFLHPVSALKGSRPLVVCGVSERILYGEYHKNREGQPVSIWESDLTGEKWNSVYEFSTVRHVHGVFNDPYDGALWVTTGDSDQESAIWRSRDGFKSLEKIWGGSQKFRAIQLLFTKNHIYYGTDAPDKINKICRISRLGADLEILQSVSGPVFYGCNLSGKLFFSTVIEPSRVNKSREAELWASPDGKNWDCVALHKKDIWSPWYFQYGQLTFPSGPGDGSNLWYTSLSTVDDDVTYKVPVETLFKGSL